MRKKLHRGALFFGVFIILLIGFLSWFFAKPDSLLLDKGIIVNKEYIDVSLDSTNLSEFSILTYNIQWGAGTEEVWLTDRSAVEKNLKDISNYLRNSGADVVFLQEVDFYSWRSNNINEIKFLQENSKFPFAAFVETWDVKYLPYPFSNSSEHLKKVSSGMAVLSKYPLRNQKTHFLSKDGSNGFLFNFGSINRLVQELELDFNGKDIKLYNIHFEAFNELVNTKQTKEFINILKNNGGEYIVAAGDFNTVPYESTNKEINSDLANIKNKEPFTGEGIRLLDDLEKIYRASKENYGLNESGHFTFPTIKPDRKIDYVFLSPNMDLIFEGVEYSANFSDHLPYFVKVIVN